MLQKFAGSVEQGFYGLSYQIGAVCFLFTSAITPLITREFAIAFGKKDLREMARLFRRYIPMFYAIAAFLGCFVAGNADKVTYLFGGSKFANASLAVSIMALYPIYQTYGQLSGSVFFATGQTRLYRNIGVTFMILGLPATYFLIAPENMMGLNAGSTGLAIKTIVLAFVAINVQLFFNTRFLRLSFLRFLWHQVYSLGCLWMCVHLSAIITDKMLGEDSTLSFFVSGIVYVLIVCLAVYTVPSIFGVTREEIRFRIIKRILPI
jgi:O-antigen/teichoic acid export membrane protein